MLSLGTARVLTLVRAPAGFGKTTVLADWRRALQAENHTVAWITLDEDDNDPNTFVTYLSRGLADALGTLKDHVPAFDGQPGSAPPRVVLTSLINALDSLEVPVVLILDDYDRIHAGAIHDLLSFLLLHAPENLRVVVAARSEPPLPLAHLRAHDELVEIDVRHLRFSYEDARLFLGEVADIQLDTGVMRSVHEATEGWVAGLQMAAISLRERGDAGCGIERLSGGTRAINAYLNESVLPSLDAHTVDLLLRLSIVERFDAELFEALTGAGDGAGLLHRLQHQNYFLQALDDEHAWFRFHALFRDCLTAELTRRLPLEIPVLHETAARWFAEHKLWPEAVRHALAADQIDLAVDWVEQCAMREVEDSRVHTLLAWARKLPDDALRGRHRLRLAVAWAQLLTIQLDDAWRGVDELEAEIRKGAIIEAPAMESELLALRFCITALRDETAAALPIGERFLERVRRGLRPDEQTVWSVQATLNGLTFCYQKAGRVDEARAMQQADFYPEGPDSSRNLFTQCYRATTLGACDVRQGRLYDGARQLREVIVLAERHAGRRSPAATLVACSLSALQYEWNELDEVDQLLADRLDIVDEACYLDSVRSAYLSMTRLAAVRGDYEAAHRLLDRGELVANRRRWTRLTAVCLSERVRLYLLDHHPLEAEASLERLERLAPAHAPAVASALSEVWRLRCLTLARWLLHSRRPAEAVETLQAVLADENPQLSPYFSLRTQVLLAVALRQDGQEDAARERVVQILSAGSACGALRSIADDGAPLIELLRTEVERQKRVEGAPVAWLDSLLATLGSSAIETAIEPSPPQRSRSGLIEPLSKRELDVLTLVAKGLSNEQAARALRLSTETVKWHLKNVFGKLGVTRRTSAVHRARLMDLIPDEKR